MVTNVNPRKLGMVLHLLRVSRGMKQEEVAARVDVSRSYIGQLETGRVGNPGWLEMMALADVFGLTVYDLTRMAEEYEERFAPYLPGKADAFRGVDAPAA